MVPATKGLTSTHYIALENLRESWMPSPVPWATPTPVDVSQRSETLEATPEAIRVCLYTSFVYIGWSDGPHFTRPTLKHLC